MYTLSDVALIKSTVLREVLEKRGRKGWDESVGAYLEHPSVLG